MKYPRKDKIELEFKEGKSELLKFMCCDCGLVHQMAFAIEKNGNLGVALRRDNRATAAARKSKCKYGNKKQWQTQNTN